MGTDKRQEGNTGHALLVGQHLTEREEENQMEHRRRITEDYTQRQTEKDKQEYHHAKTPLGINNKIQEMKDLDMYPGREQKVIQGNKQRAVSDRKCTIMQGRDKIVINQRDNTVI